MITAPPLRLLGHDFSDPRGRYLLTLAVVTIVTTPGNPTFAAPGQTPALETAVVPELYQRQPVFYRTSEPPGTIIIDTPRRFLYLVQPNNTALRYGVKAISQLLGPY